MDVGKFPPEAWLAINTLISVVSALGLAFIAYLQARQSRKLDVNTLKTEQTQVKVEELTEAVNGPLSESLQTIARITRENANKSGSKEDIQTAKDAEAALKTHEEGKRSAHFDKQKGK